MTVYYLKDANGNQFPVNSTPIGPAAWRLEPLRDPGLRRRRQPGGAPVVGGDAFGRDRPHRLAVGDLEGACRNPDGRRFPESAPFAGACPHDGRNDLCGAALGSRFSDRERQCRVSVPGRLDADRAGHRERAQTFPYACTQIVAAATTATATCFNPQVRLSMKIKTLAALGAAFSVLASGALAVPAGLAPPAVIPYGSFAPGDLIVGGPGSNQVQDLGQQPVKSNATTVAPTASNDSTQGYAVGSVWLNTSTGNLYVATSVAVGAATWAYYVPKGSIPAAVTIGWGSWSVPANATYYVAPGGPAQTRITRRLPR